MWINLYNSVHNSLGMHFWELPTLIAAVVLLAEVIVHNRKQKKREEQFDSERREKVNALRNRETA